MEGIDQRRPTVLGGRFALPCLIIASLILILPISTAAQVDKTAGDGESVPVVAVAQDREIEQRLEKILGSTGWFDAVRVTVRDGVVTLDGNAETPEQQAWAGQLAEKTEGTVAVVNRIEVSSDIGTTFTRAGEEFMELVRQAVKSWPVVVLAVAVLLITGLVAKAVAALSRAFLAPRIESPLLLAVVVRSLSIPILLLGIYFVLQAAGLTRLALTILGGTGLAGIIIGFAFRDIAENFLASVLLSVRNPFSSGDLIEVAGHTGIVQNLNTRSSVLLTLDGNHVQIPNAVVYKSTIKNYSSIPSRRAEFSVGIGYDSSTSTAQDLIAEVLQDHPAVLDDPEPLVLVNELGDATVNLQVFYWFDSATYSPAKINSALLRLSKNALLKGGIELPDPAREVVFPKGVPVIESGGSHLSPALPTVAAEEDASAVTMAEGDLTSETTSVREKSIGNVLEAEENLLRR